MIESFLLSHLRVSLPLFAGLRERIERWLFLQTYQHSQECHDHRSEFAQQWLPLGAQVEYSLHLESIATPGPRTSFIAVRSTNASESLRKIELRVEAADDTLAYEDCITLHHITQRPKLAAMPSIPPRGAYLGRNNSLETPYKTLTVYLIHLFKDDEIVESDASGPAHRPDHYFVLNSTYKQRFGRVWNLDWIEIQKEEIRNFLQWSMASPRYIRARGGKYPPGRMLPEILRRVVGRPLFRIVARKWVISLVFWIPIWLRINSHKKDGEAQDS